MDKQSTWSDEEIKTLFKFVEIKKQEGTPLIKIFAEYATKTLRHANSVRNYYYKELSDLTQNVNRAKKLDIDITKHNITKSKPFSKQEEQDVVCKIEKLKSNGYSVRRACLELSNGDVSSMIRLQNKYRALTKSNTENSKMGEIIKMPTRPQRLSDEELKALFLGLVKIVKKQETETAKALYEQELFEANKKLKSALEELVAKQNDIARLKNELAVVRQENLAFKNSKSLKGKNKSASFVLKKYFYGQKPVITQKLEGN